MPEIQQICSKYILLDLWGDTAHKKGPSESQSCLEKRCMVPVTGSICEKTE